VNVLDRLGRAIKAVELQEIEVQHPEAVIAPMPGTIVSVEVEEGESVEAGQGLVIVEAMKMENEVRAQAGGCVQVIHVASGDAVEKGKILVELVPLEEGTI
jgi:pyruvate carboxylase subunit B